MISAQQVHVDLDLKADPRDSTATNRIRLACLRMSRALGTLLSRMMEGDLDVLATLAPRPHARVVFPLPLLTFPAPSMKALTSIPVFYHETIRLSILAHLTKKQIKMILGQNECEQLGVISKLCYILEEHPHSCPSTSNDFYKLTQFS